MRYASLDALRGLSLLAMIAYHAAWDLTYFGFAQFDLLHDPLWLAARTVIATAFLLISGVCLVLAPHTWAQAGQRTLLLAGAALAISIVTLWAMPTVPIFFGILHLLAVSGLLGRLFLPLPLAVPVVTLVALLGLALVPGMEAFDPPWLLWTGLAAHPLPAADYVPLIPWFAVVLAGLTAGRMVFGTASHPRWFSHALAWQPRGRAGRGLVLAGRHSLAVYLLHQPLLVGGLLLALQVGGPSPQPVSPPATGATDPVVRGFLSSCQVSCEKSGGSLTRCSEYCRCVVTDLQRKSLWAPFRENHMDQSQKDQLASLIQSCVRRSAGQAP